MSKFITFEGPEGSGKSTQIKLLTECLNSQGQAVYTTREPGGTAIGNQIRHILHDNKHVELAPITEILLYSASRAQLVNQVIRPHLMAGTVVLCDRYADSTFAYQGYGRKIDLDMLQTITHFATQALKPDLTIYLDLPVEIGLTRKKEASLAGQGEWNRMDEQPLAFHNRVREGYLTLAKSEPERWVMIDAQQSISATHEAVCATLGERFPDLHLVEKMKI